MRRPWVTLLFESALNGFLRVDGRSCSTWERGCEVLCCLFSVVSERWASIFLEIIAHQIVTSQNSYAPEKFVQGMILQCCPKPVLLKQYLLQSCNVNVVLEYKLQIGNLLTKVTVMWVISKLCWYFLAMWRHCSTCVLSGLRTAAAAVTLRMASR